MALSGILNQILTEAREESAEILARGEAEALKILREAEQEAASLHERLTRRGEEDLRREMDKRLSSRRLEGRKRALALKNELLGKLLDRLPARLQDREAGEYADFLASLVGDDLAGQPARLEVGAKDLAVFGGVLPRLVRDRLRKRYPRWELEASESPGGFEAGLVVNAGKVVHNLSLSVLMAEGRERMEVRLSRELFAERP